MIVLNSFTLIANKTRHDCVELKFNLVQAKPTTILSFLILPIPFQFPNSQDPAPSYHPFQKTDKLFLLKIRKDIYFRLLEFFCGDILNIRKNNQIP